MHYSPHGWHRIRSFYQDISDPTIVVQSDAPAFDLAACLAAVTPSVGVDLACNIHGSALCLTAL